MKPHSNVLVERGGALQHHPAQRALFQHAFSLFEQTFKRTLVQFSGMLYNVSYFVDSRGFADELTRSAPGARASPKRKKPVVSTPLVSPGKYSFALVGPMVRPQTPERSSPIRSDDSIAFRKSPEILDFFRSFSRDLPCVFRGKPKDLRSVVALLDRFYHTQSTFQPTLNKMKEGFVWIL